MSIIRVNCLTGTCAIENTGVVSVDFDSLSGGAVPFFLVPSLLEWGSSLSRLPLQNYAKSGPRSL